MYVQDISLFNTPSRFVRRFIAEKKKCELSFILTNRGSFYVRFEKSQKWRFAQVEGCYNTYNVFLQEKLSNGRRMLSCRSDGFVDLHDHDDGSGRQRWNVVPQANGLILLQIGGGTHFQRFQ